MKDGLVVACALSSALDEQHVSWIARRILFPALCSVHAVVLLILSSISRALGRCVRSRLSGCPCGRPPSSTALTNILSRPSPCTTYSRIFVLLLETISLPCVHELDGQPHPLRSPASCVQATSRAVVSANYLPQCASEHWRSAGTTASPYLLATFSRSRTRRHVRRRRRDSLHSRTD